MCEHPKLARKSAPVGRAPSPDLEVEEVAEPVAARTRADEGLVAAPGMASALRQLAPDSWI